MGFRFSLQPVLNHRKLLEERAQRDFSLARQRVEELRNMKQGLEEDVANRGAQIRRAMLAGIGFAERSLWENWIRAQRAEALRLAREIDEAQRLADEKRARLVHAMQQRTVLDRLRERELADWRREQDRAERRDFDEIAVRDYAEQMRQAKAAAQAERIAG